MKELTLHRLGFHRFILHGTCAGNSMQPLIKPAAKLEINVDKKTTYETGDIVVILYRSSYVAHRIIAIKRDKGIIKYLIKGDNNSKTDGEFKRFQIVGRVETVTMTNRVLHLQSPAHRILRMFFVCYSFCNQNGRFYRASLVIRKFKPFRYLYDRIVYQ